jgi:hypothetical protein
MSTFWPEKRRHPIEMKRQFETLYEVRIETGRMEEENEWLDMVRGLWGRSRGSDGIVTYYFVNDFDAIMCKMWFQ